MCFNVDSQRSYRSFDCPYIDQMMCHAIPTACAGCSSEIKFQVTMSDGFESSFSNEVGYKDGANIPAVADRNRHV